MKPRAGTPDEPNRDVTIHEQLRLGDEEDAWRCARWSRRIELVRQAALAAAAWMGVLMMPDVLALVSGLLDS